MDAIVTAITAQATSLTTNIGVIALVALGVGGAIFGARLGWRFFKGMAK